jgi:hypothetical protein
MADTAPSRTKDAYWSFTSGLSANRTLLSSVWAAAAVPASVLTAARKLKYSWILPRLPSLSVERLFCRLSDS